MDSADGEGTDFYVSTFTIQSNLRKASFFTFTSSSIVELIIPPGRKDGGARADLPTDP